MSHYDWLQTVTGVLQRIRATHTPDPANYCRECTRDWPCKTFRLANLQDPQQEQPHGYTNR